MNLYSSSNVFDDLNQSNQNSKRFHSNSMVKGQQSQNVRKSHQSMGTGKMNQSNVILKNLVGSKNADERAQRGNNESRSLQAKSNMNSGAQASGQAIYSNPSQEGPFTSSKF